MPPILLYHPSSKDEVQKGKVENFFGGLQTIYEKDIYIKKIISLKNQKRFYINMKM